MDYRSLSTTKLCGSMNSEVPLMVEEPISKIFSWEPGIVTVAFLSEGFMAMHRPPHLSIRVPVTNGFDGRCYPGKFSVEVSDTEADKGRLSGLCPKEDVP